MADFSWLLNTTDDEWHQRAKGWCLKALRWPELQARSGATQSGYELVRSFRVWAEMHRDPHFALTWDIPITPTSYVYVCKLSEDVRKSA